jgi:hypothetical protein
MIIKNQNFKNLTMSLRILIRIGVLVNKMKNSDYNKVKLNKFNNKKNCVKKSRNKLIFLRSKIILVF